MRTLYQQRVAMALVVATLAFSLSGCLKRSAQQYSIPLEMWGVVDDSDAFAGVFNDYKLINPFVSDIKYRKLLVDDYKRDLLDALASPNPPDIFVIRNTWLPEFKDKIQAAPPEIINEKLFRDTFPDVAETDLIADGGVYGMPLSIDSLALYYNKDLFNYEGIIAPPATWEEFNEDVKKLTKIGGQGEITQSGAAMGTAYNINRSTDILNALMAQNGVPTVDIAHRSLDFTSRGENAFTFYTQFANRSSALYSWNPLMHYSLDAFYEGKVAMMFNYSWHYDTIRRKNANLNFAVAPLPQMTGGAKANYANYWALVVSKNKVSLDSPDPKLRNTVRISEAWQFLKYLGVNNAKTFPITNFITGNIKEQPVAADAAKRYLDRTRKPAARIDIIEEQKADPVLSAFAVGNLVAKSWYQPNPDEMERIMAESINGVNYGQSSIYETVQLMERRMEAFFTNK